LRNPSPKTAIEYALSLIATADFSTADSLLDTAEEMFPTRSTELAEVRVRSALLKGEFDAAITLVELLPHTVRPLYLGMAYYFQGCIGEALSTLNPLMEQAESPNWIEACIFNMACLLQAGRPEDALDLSSRVSKSLPGEAFHLDSLGQIHAVALADAGHLREAVEEIASMHRYAVDTYLGLKLKELWD
jgi:hypothetical protein